MRAQILPAKVLPAFAKAPFVCVCVCVGRMVKNILIQKNNHARATLYVRTETHHSIILPLPSDRIPNPAGRVVRVLSPRLVGLADPLKLRFLNCARWPQSGWELGVNGADKGERPAWFNTQMSFRSSFG